ncbi:MAG: 2-dehydropantoate 2-reductase [Anaerolineales bacterium]|nr:2-dehydropantoate 2-reductase [Anaerolineales bacterium]
MTENPKIAIVGVGPVGGIMAAFLAQAGHYVVSCDIQEPHLNAIKESGISVSGITKMTSECKRVAYSVSELSNFPEVDTVFIATKASILPFIIPQLVKVSRSGMRFISCQNGLDNEEFLADAFDADNVLRMVINYGGSQMGNGMIHMSFFNPPNYIGALTTEGEPLAQTLAQILTDSDLETQFTTDIKKYEWEKVVLNAALNPVCALTRKPMKDMMDLKLTESLVEELLREGIAVANAAGITFDEGFFEHGIQYLKNAGYHRTSMHQDVLRRFPTEIDWISRKVVEKGRKFGVQTPYNYTITALVKGLEMESGAPKED